MFVRRSGWTFAIGLVVVVAFVYAVEIDARPNLAPTRFAVVGGAQQELGSASGFYSSNGIPSNAWEKSNGIAPVGSTSAPSAALMRTLSRELNDCQESSRGRRPGGYQYCVDKYHVELFATYVSDSEYWTIQLREGSIYVGAALLLAGCSFLTVRRMLA